VGVVSFLQWEDQIGVRNLGHSSTHLSGTLSCHWHMAQIADNCGFFLQLIPGHQPEMPDCVKLLLRDAIILGFLTDCLLKSID